MRLLTPRKRSNARASTASRRRERVLQDILTGPDTGTLPVFLATFVGDRTIDWGGVASTGVLVILPLVVLGLLVQRNLIKGLTMGAMKG